MSARLRQKLQQARGALFVLRHPEDAGKPVKQWRFNPNMLRDMNANYNFCELMEETVPEGDGLSLLIELGRLKDMLGELEFVDGDDLSMPHCRFCGAVGPDRNPAHPSDADPHEPNCPLAVALEKPIRHDDH